MKMFQVFYSNRNLWSYPRAKRKVLTENDKTVCYLNCGDWTEHFTAAEFNDGNWSLYYHHKQAEELQPEDLDIPEENQLFQIISKRLFT